MRRYTVVAVLLVAAAVTASVAYGYVRGRTKGLKFTYWTSGCIFITPDSGGTPDLASNVVFQTVQKSMSNWTSRTSSCGYMQLMYQTPQPLEAHYDGINTVKFRTDRWCHPNDAQQMDVCYSSAAAGITTIFYVDHGSAEGTILDADIELNDIDFTFAVIDPNAPLPPARPGTSVADLENTLTHELGHVQGLDHTCTDQATPPQEINDQGNPPPLCTALDTLPPAERIAITGATMYNFAKQGEISKRTPTADDIAGVCSAYPSSQNPNSCKPVNLAEYSGTGCTFAGSQARSSLMGEMLVLLAFFCGAILRWRAARQR